MTTDAEVKEVKPFNGPQIWKWIKKYAPEEWKFLGILMGWQQPFMPSFEVMQANSPTGLAARYRMAVETPFCFCYDGAWVPLTMIFPLQHLTEEYVKKIVMAARGVVEDVEKHCAALAEEKEKPEIDKESVIELPGVK